MPAPPVVAITESEYRRGEPVFGAASEVTFVVSPPAEDVLAAAIARAGAVHAIVGSTPYRGPLYQALPRGAVLARFGVGHESIDKGKATEAGLLCTNTPDVLQQSVAELTLLMIGAAARHLLQVATAFRAGQWSPRQGIELEGTTLTIVGCGAIGGAVARIAAAGYGMRVVGYRRANRGQVPYHEHYDRVTEDFAAAVQDADFVSLHMPGSPENVRFINRERLALFPARAWLVNTARGAVVDERALHEALAAGRIAGAALDVFEREPYQAVDADHDLRGLPQVLPVPHIGSNTAEANRRMAERALRNVLLGQAGDVAAMDLLNPEVL